MGKKKKTWAKNRHTEKLPIFSKTKKWARSKKKKSARRAINKKIKQIPRTKNMGILEKFQTRFTGVQSTKKCRSKNFSKTDDTKKYEKWARCPFSKNGCTKNEKKWGTTHKTPSGGTPW